MHISDNLSKQDLNADKNDLADVASAEISSSGNEQNQGDEIFQQILTNHCMIDQSDIDPEVFNLLQDLLCVLETDTAWEIDVFEQLRKATAHQCFSESLLCNSDSMPGDCEMNRNVFNETVLLHYKNKLKRSQINKKQPIKEVDCFKSSAEACSFDINAFVDPCQNLFSTALSSSSNFCSYDVLQRNLVQPNIAVQSFKVFDSNCSYNKMKNAGTEDVFSNVASVLDDILMSVCDQNDGFSKYFERNRVQHLSDAIHCDFAKCIAIDDKSTAIANNIQTNEEMKPQKINSLQATIPVAIRSRDIEIAKAIVLECFNPLHLSCTSSTNFATSFVTFIKSLLESCNTGEFVLAENCQVNANLEGFYLLEDQAPNYESDLLVCPASNITSSKENAEICIRKIHNKFANANFGMDFLSFSGRKWFNRNLEAKCNVLVDKSCFENPTSETKIKVKLYFNDVFNLVTSHFVENIKSKIIKESEKPEESMTHCNLHSTIDELKDFLTTFDVYMSYKDNHLQLEIVVVSDLEAKKNNVGKSSKVDDHLHTNTLQICDKLTTVTEIKEISTDGDQCFYASESEFAENASINEERSSTNTDQVKILMQPNDNLLNSESPTAELIQNRTDNVTDYSDIEITSFYIGGICKEDVSENTSPENITEVFDKPITINSVEAKNVPLFLTNSETENVADDATQGYAIDDLNFPDVPTDVVSIENTVKAVLELIKSEVSSESSVQQLAVKLQLEPQSYCAGVAKPDNSMHDGDVLMQNGSFMDQFSNEVNFGMTIKSDGLMEQTSNPVSAFYCDTEAILTDRRNTKCFAAGKLHLVKSAFENECGDKINPMLKKRELNAVEQNENSATVKDYRSSKIFKLFRNAAHVTHKIGNTSLHDAKCASPLEFVVADCENTTNCSHDISEQVSKSVFISGVDNTKSEWESIKANANSEFNHEKSTRKLSCSYEGRNQLHISESKILTSLNDSSNQICSSKSPVVNQVCDFKTSLSDKSLDSSTVFTFAVPVLNNTKKCTEDLLTPSHDEESVAMQTNDTLVASNNLSFSPLNSPELSDFDLSRESRLFDKAKHLIEKKEKDRKDGLAAFHIIEVITL